jgi:hypothetical protein
MYPRDVFIVMRFWRCCSYGLYICSAAMFMKFDNLYMYVSFVIGDVASISRIYLYVRAFYRLLEVGCYKLVLESWSVLSRPKPVEFSCLYATCTKVLSVLVVLFRSFRWV